MYLFTTAAETAERRFFCFSDTAPKAAWDRSKRMQQTCRHESDLLRLESEIVFTGTFEIPRTSYHVCFTCNFLFYYFFFTTSGPKFSRRLRAGDAVFEGGAKRDTRGGGIPWNTHFFCVVFMTRFSQHVPYILYLYMVDAHFLGKYLFYFT